MKPFEHGGNIYSKCPSGGKWLDFSANINPLGMPGSVKNVIIEHIGDAVNYPEPDSPRLKAAIAESYGIDPSCIVPGNGGAELIYLCLYVLRPKRVLVPVPSFGEYERAARAAGAETEFIKLDPQKDFFMPWEELYNKAREQDCIILGNPNNPTGNMFPREDLEALLKVCEDKDCHLIADESFLDFREDRREHTLIGLCPAFRNLTVIRSMTKFFAIPGLRLGFAVTNDDFRERMEQGKDVWNVNLLAQLAGVAALSDREYAEKTRKWLPTEREFMANELRAIPGIEVFSPTVNFVLIRFREESQETGRILSGMRERGILLRDCGNYRGLPPEGYLRVAVRSRKENAIMLEALKKTAEEVQYP